MNSYQYTSYDRAIPHIPKQKQYSEGEYITTEARQQGPSVLPNSRPQQRSKLQKPQSAERMPKARVLALSNILKKWLVATSLVGFLSFGGLVASHQVSTTATQTSSGSSQTTSSTNSSSQNSNGFFKQQGGNNFGSNNSSNASSNGSSSSSPAPVSGSSVS